MEGGHPNYSVVIKFDSLVSTGLIPMIVTNHPESLVNVMLITMIRKRDELLELPSSESDSFSHDNIEYSHYFILHAGRMMLKSWHGHNKLSSCDLLCNSHLNCKA